MSPEEDHQHREALRRSAQETCQRSKDLCERAVNAQERAHETRRVSQLARQWRREAREMIPW
jgi:hypothetical protein